MWIEYQAWGRGERLMEDPATLEPKTRACSPRWDPRQLLTAHPGGSSQLLSGHLFILLSTAGFPAPLLSLPESPPSSLETTHPQVKGQQRWT